MQKWEYLTVTSRVAIIGSYDERQDKLTLLETAFDPDINWNKIGQIYREEKNVYKRARVVRSDIKNYITTLPSELKVLGDLGWELVGITPPLYFESTFSTDHAPSSFQIIFKRPRE